MVKRILWLAAGVAVGVIVVRKLTRTAEAMSPAGIGARLRDTAVTAGSGMRSFMADVGEGMREREAELQDAIATGQPVGEILEDDDDQ